MSEKLKFTITYSRTVQPTQYHPVHIGCSMEGTQDESIKSKYYECKNLVDELLREAEEEFK